MNSQLYKRDEIPPVLDVPSLAIFLGVGRNTAYDLVRSNQIKSLRIGRKIRIPRHAVLSYLWVTEKQ